VAGLTERAERAVLGAMIAAPLPAPGTELVEPADFASDVHRAVWCGIGPAGWPGNAGPPAREAIARQSARHPGGERVTPAYLDRLARTCPAPGHAGAYAAMVVQASMYRKLLANPGPLPAGDPRREVAASRLAVVTGSDARPEVLAVHMGSQASLRSHAERLGAGFAEPTGPHPLCRGSHQDRREERVLAAMLQGHPQAGQVLAFLPVAAMTDWYRQELLQAIRRLHAAGDPVDALTADWQVAAARARTGGQLVRAASAPEEAETYATRLARAERFPAGEPLVRAARDLQAGLEHRVRAPGRTAQPASHARPAFQAPLLRPPPGLAGPSAGSPQHRM
jgi:hypothetical protein